jgi:hypothetical protein
LCPLPITSRAFLGLRIALGVFLLVTAGLKLHGLVVDPLAGDSFLASPRLQIAAIEVELLLGLWLLSGWQLCAARLVALAFFGILASASLWLALQGQSSCGCFGRVQVNPWATFALDVVIVAALGFVPMSAASSNAVSWAGILRIVSGAAVLLAGIVGIFFLAFDNPLAALAHLRGERIVVQPAVSDVGEGVSGEWRDFEILITNHGDSPVRIVGGTDDCACSTTSDLPVTIPAHGSAALTLRGRLSGTPGRFLQRYVLYTDDSEQGVLTARFAGRIRAPALP